MGVGFGWMLCFMGDSTINWAGGSLSAGGVVTTVRKTRGDDIDAACGQLAGEVRDRTKVRERSVSTVSLEELKGSSKRKA